MFACADVHTPARVCATRAAESVCDDRTYPYTACNVFEVTVTISYGEHRHINMLLCIAVQHISGFQ